MFKGGRFSDQVTCLQVKIKTNKQTRKHLNTGNVTVEVTGRWKKVETTLRKNFIFSVMLY